MLNKGDFSVVIATFNNKDMVLSLLSTLLLNKAVGEVIVVDDGSKDGTHGAIARLIRENTRDVQTRLIRNKSNTGVIAPRNQGLRKATRKYTVIFDDDQIPSIHTFSRYTAALEQYDIVGYIPGMIDLEVGAVVVDSSQPFNHVGEGGMCMKTSLWAELNYFDEAFSPAYREGPDIQLRALQKGKTVGCVLDADIVHLESKTLGRGDIGFNRAVAGAKSHGLIMSRLRNGYYGDAFKAKGSYYGRIHDRG